MAGQHEYLALPNKHSMQVCKRSLSHVGTGSFLAEDEHRDHENNQAHLKEKSTQCKNIPENRG